MGAEAHCVVHAGGKSSSGKALLETEELVFRGDFRLVVPFKKVESAKPEKGVLVLVVGGEKVRLELGEKLAAKWAEKIANPKSRAEKLGIKPGLRVSIVGLDDEGFASEVRALTKEVTIG